MSARRGAVAALIAVALASSFAQFGSISALHDVARHFGHPATRATLRGALGLSGSTLGLGLAALRAASLLALPLAALADRVGRTPVLRVTVVAGLVVTALAATSPSYWVFVALFALARPMLSASSALVSVLTVELSEVGRRVPRLVLVAAGAGVGAGLSALLHGVVRGPDSFRWLFALAVVPLVVLVPARRAVAEPAWARGSGDLARLGVMPRGQRATLARVCLLTAVAAVVTGPANGFAFAYGEGILKLSAGHVSAIVVSSGVTGLAGLVLGRQLANGWGRRPTAALGILATTAASTLAYAGGVTDFTAGYLAGVFAAGVLTPAAMAISTEVFPHGVRATAQGWAIVAAVVGAVAGLALFGYVGDVVNATGPGSLRVAALVTFLPLTPLVALLAGLPETRGVEIG